VIGERSVAIGTLDALARRIAAAWSGAGTRRSVARMVDDVKRRPPPERWRGAAVALVTALVVYVPLAAALPVKERPVVPLAAIVLLLACGTALALPFRK
jgi:hypothetical protein